MSLRALDGTFTPVFASILIAKAPLSSYPPGCTLGMWHASILRHERAHTAGWPSDHPK